MALEIEVKVRVVDHRGVRKALVLAGARPVKSELETNTFLDTPDAALLHEGRGLRVRCARDQMSGAIRVLITHKGKRRPGPLKVREETELTAESYDDAVRLLNVLGFEVKLSFQKRRETWHLDDCEVVLDELPVLGRFVEVEGPQEKVVTSTLARLGLADAPVEPEGYAVLVANHLKATGGKTLTFAD